MLAAARRAAYERRIRSCAVVGVLAALAIAPAADAEVKSPRVIEAAHGRDLVILSDYPANTPVQVDVLRAGIVIATSTQYKTDDEGFLELNHVGGDDCFDGGTAPDVRPGDTIRTTIDGDDIDSMIVQNVTYDGPPAERMVTRTVMVPNPDPTLPDIETTVTEGTGIFEVTGLARTPEGTPLNDFVEVRLNHPSRGIWDASGRRDWRVTAQPGLDGRFVAEFDTDGSASDAANAPNAEMAALWLGSLSELSGYDGTGSPCPLSPTSAITSLSHRVVSSGVETITLSGPVQEGVTATVNFDGTVTQDAGGWTATIPAANLAEGDNVVTVSFSGPGAPSADSRLVRKDTTAPAAPTADLAGGAYDLPQTVHLYGEHEVRYTTDGSDPTSGSPKFSGGISVTAARTIKAIAIDAAGNASAVATFAYEQKPAPPVAKPEPQTVIVERPVEVIREVVTPAPPVVVPVVVAQPGIDRVSAPRRVTLAKARKGVRILVDTKATSIRVKADQGARTTVTSRNGAGYAVVVKAKRKRTYRISIALPGGARTVVLLKVR